ncbi:TetR/AcrR family transcriptional regulator [Leucobacter viscericola]|uniref:TetR/AcrR family transcriptional regulator n=1 Tax=Leucobacter viscericola TaxID=2714935 RepID=A0A6G7XHL6_9MICO|nr:TetR/AcrR family transcriptional regulator [Leucobacter viscericola]QIK64043.1 TetR/AcrR family transcriptional regulator [Leucobacter viscericola]
MAELDARERILTASRQEIAASGVRGLRVQQVAKRAGVSLGLVYYHFEDRTGLLNATIDAVNRAVQDRGPVSDASLSPAESITTMLAAEFGDAGSTRDDSVVWNEIRAIAVFETEIQAALSQTTREWEGRLSEPLEHAGVPSEAIAETATLLTGLVEGLSSRWLSGQLDTATAQKLMRRGVSAILAATIT